MTSLGVKGLKKTISLNPFTPKSDLIDFTLSNARRFYSSKGDPLGVKGLKVKKCVKYTNDRTGDVVDSTQYSMMSKINK